MYTWTRCFSSPGLISDGWLGRQDQLSSSSLTLNHQIELLWRIIVKNFILQPALDHSTYGLPPYLSWQMRPIVWSVFHPAWLSLRYTDDGTNQAPGSKGPNKQVVREKGFGAHAVRGPKSRLKESLGWFLVTGRCNALRWDALSEVPLLSRARPVVSPGWWLGRPDWDYNTRRMVSRRILGQPMFQPGLISESDPQGPGVKWYGHSWVSLLIWQMEVS